MTAAGSQLELALAGRATASPRVLGGADVLELSAL